MSHSTIILHGNWIILKWLKQEIKWLKAFAIVSRMLRSAPPNIGQLELSRSNMASSLIDGGYWRDLRSSPNLLWTLIVTTIVLRDTRIKLRCFGSHMHKQCMQSFKWQIPQIENMKTRIRGITRGETKRYPGFRSMREKLRMNFELDISKSYMVGIDSVDLCVRIPREFLRHAPGAFLGSRCLELWKSLGNMPITSKFVGRNPLKILQLNTSSSVMKSTNGYIREIKIYNPLSS
jgi:hypothetical protein